MKLRFQSGIIILEFTSLTVIEGIHNLIWNERAIPKETILMDLKIGNFRVRNVTGAFMGADKIKFRFCDLYSRWLTFNLQLLSQTQPNKPEGRLTPIMDVIRSV